ncbi:hypothetical protein M422DRAFT_70402 [Sphaerobolus stellatus SS14]|uniref:ABC transporter substrate-binding protein n=1 Tax=Sphaerobolus stellatus (strain SS14) TaxID=990650 RepID=A0A0C9V7U2_SPHS4|nr:hypothetical protein M422DRAFT_70402 [Sphaerobolus stellatus SS14]
MRTALLSSALLSFATVASAFDLWVPQAPVPVESRTLDEIYAAAKQEHGTLQVAWGGDEPGFNADIFAAFRSRFPAVKLNATVDLSKYHDSRIDRSFVETGKENIDVVVLQTVQDFPRWNLEERLLPYKVSNWDSILPYLKDESAAFTPLWIYTFGNFYYSTSKVAASDVPTTYADFLDPKWKNKLVLTYPNDDDAVNYLFSTIIKNHGWQWLDGLVKQNVTWVRGTGTPHTLLERSSNNTQSNLAITFTTFAPVDASVAMATPNDEVVSWAQPGGIFKSTSMPETAKLFLNYMLSNDIQSTMIREGSVSALQNISGNGNPFASGKNPLRFTTFAEDRQLVDYLKLQFETTLGPPQGLSPLIDGI